MLCAPGTSSQQSDTEVDDDATQKAARLYESRPHVVSCKHLGLASAATGVEIVDMFPIRRHGFGISFSSAG